MAVAGEGRGRLSGASEKAAGGRTLRGVACVLLGGSFWGLSGTCASYLFAAAGVDAVWLVCVRQFLAGMLFLAYAAAFQRDRLHALARSPRDLAVVVAYAVFGLVVNQYSYLITIEHTNSGTATVLQCLQLVVIMAYSCASARRRPSAREAAGLVLALAGTYLIATGGNPTSLVLPAAGLAFGLLSAVGGGMLTIIPLRILPSYGTPVIIGVGMLLSSVGAAPFVRPWESLPAFDATSAVVFAVLVVAGTFLAQLLYMQGVVDLGPVRASLLATSEPVAATVSSVLAMGVVFAATDLAGFALILVMMFLVA